MSDTKPYTPTDPNAVFAAGQRIPEDRVLHLTDEQARYELLAGTIVPAAAPAPAKPAKKD
jgi:hypothetical protein